MLKKILRRIEENRQSNNSLWIFLVRLKDCCWELSNIANIAKPIFANMIIFFRLRKHLKDWKIDEENNKQRSNHQKINLIYFSCKKHFKYLFGSLKSLERLKSDKIGKIYLYIDRRDFLSEIQKKKIKNFHLNTVLRKTRYKMSHLGINIIMNELIGFKEVGEEVDNNDYIAKVDSDTLFISDKIFNEVINLNQDVIGHYRDDVNKAYLKFYIDGGCYFFKNNVFRKIRGMKVYKFLKTASKKKGVSLERLPEDVMITLLFREINGPIKFLKYITTDNYTDSDVKNGLNIDKIKKEGLDVIHLRISGAVFIKNLQKIKNERTE